MADNNIIEKYRTRNNANISFIHKFNKMNFMSPIHILIIIKSSLLNHLLTVLGVPLKTKNYMKESIYYSK